MGPYEYTVEKIEGDYATLKRNDTDDEILVAMALLPMGTDIGIELIWENFTYSLK